MEVNTPDEHGIGYVIAFSMTVSHEFQQIDDIVTTFLGSQLIQDFGRNVLLHRRRIEYRTRSLL